MNYVSILNQLLENKIIAILRLDSPQKAQKGIEALKKGGIQAIEVTLNTPGALQVISHYQNVSDLLIGAGTVLDEASCLNAIQHGAQYIVTPTLNEGVIKCANRYQKPVICGCMTPTRNHYCFRTWGKYDQTIPGFYPWLDSIKAIKAPIPQALIGPTGGVNLENITVWQKSGADFYGIAGEFSKLANEEKYSELTEIAHRYSAAISH